MTTKQKKITIVGAIILVLALVLVLPPKSNQLEDSTISFETVSTSSEFFRINAELPSADLPGATIVRSFITEQNDYFIALADQEGPEIAEIRGDVVQFTQDILVDATTTDELISYEVRTGTYTGGANANSTVETFVFDQYGNHLSNEDLISEDQQEEFMTSLREALSSNPNTFPGAGEEVSLERLNLYVTNDSIHVVFSEYVVGPGAAGIISITLPRDPYLAE